MMRRVSSLCLLGLLGIVWPLDQAEALNQPPVLDRIGSKTVVVGDTLEFAITASDPDGDSLVFSIGNQPDNSTFTDHGIDTASFEFYPDSSQLGTCRVLFAVTDGKDQDYEMVEIIVDTTNQAPALAPIGPQSLTEGDTLTLRVVATDPDGTSPGLRSEDLPANATFVDSGGGVGRFTFIPGYVQAGEYDVTFIATDGSLADSEEVNITVLEAGNQRPALAFIDSQSVREGKRLALWVVATDPDEDSISLGVEELPANATFVDSGNGGGEFVFTPGSSQVGHHHVTFIASDGELADSQLVTITVVANLPPELTPIDSQIAVEEEVLFFWVRANDANGDSIDLTVEELPANATFQDNGNGVGRFTFTPDSSQIGHHDVTFIASDGELADTQVVAITVVEANNPPELASVGHQVVVEGEVLTLRVTATDADGDSIALTADNLPSNAAFVDSGYGIGGFSFAPDTTQAGSYQVTFIASDGLVEDVEVVTIIVASNADTLQIADTTAIAGQEVAVSIIFVNSVWVSGFNFRVEYDTTYLMATRVSIEGSRIDNRYGYTKPALDSSGVVTFLGLFELYPDQIPNEQQYLPPGSGPVAYVFFSVDSGAPEGEDFLHFADDSTSPQPDISFSDTLASHLIVPVLVDGSLLIEEDDVPDAEARDGRRPRLFALDPCYPNPFNATTVIPYHLPAQRSVPIALRVYNISGQVVRTLVDKLQPPGHHHVSWDGRDDRGREVSSGVYLCRLQAGKWEMTRRMVVLR